MGKRIISQRRGRGTNTYKAPSHRYNGRVKHRSYDNEERDGVTRGVVRELFNDPARTSPVATILFDNKEQELFLVPEGIRVGSSIATGIMAEVEIGNTLPLKNIPEGTYIYNIESRPGDGGKFVRSSGTYATLIAHDNKKTVILLPSGVMKTLNSECRCTIGVVAGGGRKEKPLVKAGNKFHKLRSKATLYPKVRGIAMNHNDHPFGGGNHKHPGKGTTCSRNAPPGRKVGHIAAKRTGRRR
ncbi:MAG TPA: 50S ribosomal protein L2 [Methanofastidiosum sp.]|nr:50S ribosomal protein L2 [Methanofastidiosum sp.]HOI77801.1 50S ribosomal protein L2 [Methanofastidiosum sp.]